LSKIDAVNPFNNTNSSGISEEDSTQQNNQNKLLYATPGKKFMNNYNIYDTPQQLYASPYNQHMMITSPMVPLVTLQPHN
jgi:hypothetical protein